MNTLREAAQRALEAIDRALPYAPHRSEFDVVADTADDLRAALAEPVQEPVAWRFEARHIDSAWAAAVTLKHPGPEGKYLRNVMPLYTAPPQRKPLSVTDLQEALVYANLIEALKMMRDKYGEYACRVCDLADAAIKQAEGENQ